MTQENTKRVEIDVLALLQKLWTKKVFILFTAFYVAVFAFLGTYFLIQPHIHRLHVFMWLIKLMMAKTFLLKICRPVHF